MKIDLVVSCSTLWSRGKWMAFSNLTGGHSILFRRSIIRDRQSCVSLPVVDNSFPTHHYHLHYLFLVLSGILATDGIKPDGGLFKLLENDCADDFAFV